MISLGYVRNRDYRLETRCLPLWAKPIERKSERGLSSTLGRDRRMLQGFVSGAGVPFTTLRHRDDTVGMLQGPLTSWDRVGYARGLEEQVSECAC